MNRPSLDELRIDRSEAPAPRGARVWWVAPVLIVALVAVAWFVWWRPADAIEVRTAAAAEYRRGESQAGTVLNASGYVTARRQATVSSKITGRVVDVLIEEGMTVEEGQVLARLDDSNIRAGYELARAQLESARRGLDETAALLEEAELNLERQQQLVAKQLASAAELDRARALERSLAARLRRNAADVDVAARQVDIYRQQLEDTIIRAPFAGVVVAKNAQPGEMVSPVSAGGGFTRTGIGTIVDMASLEVEIDVNEAYINRVSPDQSAVATLDAYPDWKIPAHVIAIIPTADRQRATVEVRVGFDELDPRILPDMGVKVAFREADADEPGAGATGVLVPAAAVRRSGDRGIVFVVADGRAERRAVAQNDFGDGSVLVTAGLRAGETVVLDPPPDLQDGMAVVEQSDE
ncbi:MAG: efflux RND transporter periplasmic adaptor subunit [Xanthomonadales bacterium]